jgi:hypothetical protein
LGFAVFLASLFYGWFSQRAASNRVVVDTDERISQLVSLRHECVGRGYGIGVEGGWLSGVIDGKEER